MNQGVNKNEEKQTDMNVMTIVGARPQFIKAAPLCAELTSRGHKNVFVHTGQHYDYSLSKVFFDELQIPEPDYNLEIGPLSPVKQISGMMNSLETILITEKPTCALVFGDTNSTLAASLAAMKCEIPIIHIEGGERNFTRDMKIVPAATIPEESNRVLVDHISSVIFCASKRAVENLAREAITDNVIWAGDISLDTYSLISQIPSNKSDILERLNIRSGEFALATVHRAINTDIPERLVEILQGLSKSEIPVIFPIHPRTRKVMVESNLFSRFTQSSNLRIVDPVGYFDMLALEKNARIIITDSGGVIREAFFSKVPSVIVDETTEWIDLVQAGWSHLVGADSQKICENIHSSKKPENWEPVLGDGTARKKIVSYLEKWSHK